VIPRKRAIPLAKTLGVATDVGKSPCSLESAACYFSASLGAVAACNLGVFTVFWAAVGAYDLLVSQFVPRENQEKWPKVPEVIGMIFGWLPWWAWGWIGTAIIAIASIEYAVRLKGEQFTGKQKPNLREAEILFNSAAHPAIESMRQLISHAVISFQSHPIGCLRPLSDFMRRGTSVHLEGQEARLINTLAGRLPLGTYSIDDLIGFFWEEYRIEVQFLRATIPVLFDCGVNIVSDALFKRWLRDDDNLRRSLKLYCASPERGKLREKLKHVWDDNVIEDILAASKATKDPVA